MENTAKTLSIVGLRFAALAVGLIHAQAPAPGPGRGGTWSTSRGDAQRTAWVRSDAYISVEELQKAGFGLEWSVKVSHAPREALSEGVSNNTTQLNPQPGNVAGSANNLYGYEVDQGELTWIKHFDVPASAAPTAACPGGMTAGVARLTGLDEGLAGAVPARAAGRGPARDDYLVGVGEPGQGLPTELTIGRGGRGPAPPGGPGVPVAGPAPATPAPTPLIAGNAAPAQPPNVLGAPGVPAGPARVGLRGVPTPTYVVTSDGVLHAIGQAQGKEILKPVRFLPANAHGVGLTLIGQTMYASTINGCGGVPNGVWSLDLPSGMVKSWNAGASPVGVVAFAPDGTLYVAIGDGTAGTNGYSDAIVALDAKTLTVKDWFSASGASFTSTPTLFPSDGRELLAAATKDGRLFLLDAASLGGSDHKTPLAVSAATTTVKTWSPSALAAWEDGSQNRWLLLPAISGKGSLIAFRVSGNTLQQAWASSSSLASPSAPVVVNGVVFVLNNGSAASPAVLYALDAATGKELWNSGNSIKSFVSTAGLWAINGQVHAATNDGVLYAFGTSQGRHL